LYEEHDTYDEVAKAISDALDNYQQKNPETMKDAVTNFMKKWLTRGLEALDKKEDDGTPKKEYILTKKIEAFGNSSEDIPSSKADVTVHFIFSVLNSLMNVKGCILNKSNSFLIAYYSILELQFGENTGLKDYNDYEQYHYDWVYSLKGDGFNMEATHINVKMNSSSNVSSE